MLKKYLIPFAASVMLLSACGAAVDSGEVTTAQEPSTTSDEPLKVVTTFPPLYSFATSVAGDLAEVTNLVEPGTSVHTWEPTASDLRALSEADLLIMNGLNLELFIEDMIDSAQNEDLEIVVTSDFLEDEVMDMGEIIELGHNDDKHEGDEHGDDHHDEDEHDHEEEKDHEHEEGNHEQGGHGHAEEDHDEKKEDHHDDGDHHDEEGHDHEDESASAEATVGRNHDNEDSHDDEHGDDHHHDHAHEGPDPHVWLNPELAMIQVEAIRDTLIELDPENTEAYQANTRAYLQKLTALDQEIFEAFGASSRSPENFIVFHNAYDYFFERNFTLKPYLKGSVEPFPGREPTAAYFQELIELIEEEDVKIVFTEPQFNPRVVQNIQEETGIQSFEIDPIGLELSPQGYENNMRALAQTLSEAFSSVESGA